MTLCMNDVYRIYAADQDPTKLFKKAAEWLGDIQCYLGDDERRASIVEEQLREAMKRAVYSSNQIEQAGLNLNSTMKLLDMVMRGELVEEIDERTPDYLAKLAQLPSAQESIKQKGVSGFIRGRREVVQHAQAMQYMIHEIVVERKPFTEALIKKTHYMLCKGVSIQHQNGTETSSEKYAGEYRTVIVAAGNSCFVPPPKIAATMARFVVDLNADIRKADEENVVDPFALAAKHSIEFVNIHPFQDGNGRLCRLILNALLCKYAGVIIPIGEDRAEIREYLDMAARNDRDYGELSTMVLKKATTRIRELKKRLNGQKRSDNTSCS
ncbi:fic/DOC family protein [Xylariaceae sp. FL0662B]|nr:fic/DOC family protein [Xylariaceae sp. FL0662B]